MEFKSITYEVRGRRALITLNRPQRMNAIDRHMPREIADAVAAANEDNAVHVIVLTGAGKGFCGGYDLVYGQEALKPGLVLDSVPLAELDERVDAIVGRIEGVPRNQLMMQKLMINQAYENMGMASTQMLATFFDGVTRNSPEGVWFKH